MMITGAATEVLRDSGQPHRGAAPAVGVDQHGNPHRVLGEGEQRVPLHHPPQRPVAPQRPEGPEAVPPSQRQSPHPGDSRDAIPDEAAAAPSRPGDVPVEQQPQRPAAGTGEHQPDPSGCMSPGPTAKVPPAAAGRLRSDNVTSLTHRNKIGYSATPILALPGRHGNLRLPTRISSRPLPRDALY